MCNGGDYRSFNQVGGYVAIIVDGCISCQHSAAVLNVSCEYFDLAVMDMGLLV